MWVEEDILNIPNDFIRSETPPRDDGVMETTDTELRTSQFCTQWLVTFIVHLQAVHHLSDIAVEATLKFLAAFFAVLGKFSSVCAGIARCFPASLHRLSVYNGTQQSF